MVKFPVTELDRRPEAEPAAVLLPPDETPRSHPAIVTIARRIPFTTTYVVITLVLSIVFGTLWSGIENKSWFGTVGTACRPSKPAAGTR